VKEGGVKRVKSCPEISFVAPYREIERKPQTGAGFDPFDPLPGTSGTSGTSGTVFQKSARETNLGETLKIRYQRYQGTTTLHNTTQPYTNPTSLFSTLFYSYLTCYGLIIIQLIRRSVGCVGLCRVCRVGLRKEERGVKIKFAGYRPISHRPYTPTSLHAPTFCGISVSISAAPPSYMVGNVVCDVALEWWWWWWWWWWW